MSDIELDLDTAAQVWADQRDALERERHNVEWLQMELADSRRGLSIKRNRNTECEGRWVAHYGYRIGGWSETYRHTAVGALVALCFAVAKH